MKIRENCARTFKLKKIQSEIKKKTKKKPICRLIKTQKKKDRKRDGERELYLFKNVYDMVNEF